MAAWLRQCVKGNLLAKAAWDARGSDPIRTVSEENLATFKQKLKEADTAYTAAWEADQSKAPAATGMLSVCMGLASPRDAMEKWFQRAMTADPDCFAACEAKMRYLMPRWHCSADDMQAFGRQ